MSRLQHERKNNEDLVGSGYVPDYLTHYNYSLTSYEVEQILRVMGFLAKDNKTERLEFHKLM